jgi:uncharacterized protein HemX
MRNTMNSAFTHHHAAKKAGRLARRAVLACALVLGAGGAFAQQNGDRRDDRGDRGDLQSQSQSQAQFSRFRLPARDRDPRDDMRAYEEQRRAQQQEQREQQHDSRRPSRLTPDERRDLRRQINEAGMDLYPQRR